MTNFKIGDSVKYDPKNSMMTWHGVIVRVTPKFVDIESSCGGVERVSKKLVNWA